MWEVGLTTCWMLVNRILANNDKLWPFLSRCNPGHFDLSLSLQAEVVCDCTVKCCRKWTGWREYWEQKSQAWLLFSQVSSPVWELTWPGWVISHPLYRENHKDYMPAVVHRKLILEWTKLKKTDPCTQELPVYFSAICLIKIWYVLTNPAALS